MRYPSMPVGVVMAGGLSSRMGSDKAMLSIDGLSMLQHQVDLLIPFCAKVLVSGDYAGFECMPDTIARCGPLGGIYSVAMHCPKMALLIIPVDMLRITSKHLERLTQNNEACHYSNQPLPAFFPDSTEVVEAIQYMFARPEQDFSIRRLHQVILSTAIMDASFEPSNINSPVDWQNFEKNNYK